MRTATHLAKIAVTILTPGAVAYAASPGFQDFVTAHPTVATIVPVVTAIWAAQIKPWISSEDVKGTTHAKRRK